MPEVILRKSKRDSSQMGVVKTEHCTLNADMEGEEVIMELDRTLTEIISKYLPELRIKKYGI